MVRHGEEWRHIVAQRGMEKWNGQSHIHVLWIKIMRDTSGARDLNPIPDHPAQGSAQGR